MLTAHDWEDACRIRWEREGKKYLGGHSGRLCVSLDS